MLGICKIHHSHKYAIITNNKLDYHETTGSEDEFILMQKSSVDDLVKALDINENDLHTIFLKNNAFFGSYNHNLHYFFKSEKNARNVIKELEPYIIMKKLKGDKC